MAEQLNFHALTQPEEIDVTFEEALGRLEEVVKSLEGGNLTLEEALQQFQTGIQLVRLCNQRLDETEGKIQLLIENADGSVTYKDGGDE